MPPTSMRARGAVTRALRRIAATTASLVLAVVLAEVLVHLLAPQPESWLDIFARHPKYPMFTLQANVERHLDSGESQWSVYTDADGHRCAAKPIATADAPSVIVLGDSFTFGLGVDYELTFCALIESAAAGRFRVINAGVGAYGPTQYRMVLEDELAKGASPRLVVVASYLGNDFQDCISDKDFPIVDGVLGEGAGSLRGIVKRNSHLYRLVARVYHQTTTHEEAELEGMDRDIYSPEAWSRSPLTAAASINRDEFARIAAICRQRSIPLLVCLIPTQLTIRSRERKAPPAPGLDAGSPERAAIDAMAGAMIDHVECEAGLLAVGASKAYFSFDGHLTPAGNRAVAADVLGHAVVRAVLGELHLK